MAFDTAKLRPDAASSRDRTSAGMGMPVTGRLDNGMDVVVLPDTRSPATTHMIWYRNGSSDDPDGKSGIAHFLEHLMFKGTERYPAGRFSRLLAAVGAEENAFTSWTYTSYFQRVPAELLRTCMEYEADRMTNLVLREAEVASERDVVLAERGMNFDSHPERRLEEAMQADVFSSTRIARPVFGWRREIEQLERQDALAYYRRFYVPGNAILVVAGSTPPEAVMAMAAECYGRIPAGNTPVLPAVPAEWQASGPASGMRRVSLGDAAVRQPLLQRIYVVPSHQAATSRECETLEVLAHLLGSGRTAYLYRRLVIEAKLATSASASYWSGVFIDRTRFDIDLCPAEGVTLEALEAGLDGALAALAAGGFAEAEVERAKRQVLAGAIYAQDDPAMLAQRYGSLLCCGQSVEDVASWPARIAAVGVEDLLRALAYLEPLNGLSGHLTEAPEAA